MKQIQISMCLQFLGRALLLYFTLTLFPIPAAAIGESETEKPKGAFQELSKEDPKFADAIGKGFQETITQGAIELNEPNRDQQSENTDRYGDNDNKGGPGSFDLNNPEDKSEVLKEIEPSGVMLSQDDVNVDALNAAIEEDQEGLVKDMPAMDNKELRYGTHTHVEAKRMLKEISDSKVPENVEHIVKEYGDSPDKMTQGIRELEPLPLFEEQPISELHQDQEPPENVDPSLPDHQ